MAKGGVRVGAVGGNLSALARDLKRAGAVSLQRKLYGGMQRAGTDTIGAIRDSARATLPKGGGRGKRRTRMVTVGSLTNAVSGRTHKVKETRRIGGDLAAGESLAERVAGASYGVRARSSRGGAAVTLLGREKSRKNVDLARIDRGEVRHPVFGKWRRGTPTQRVTPGFFTNAVEANLEEFRREIEKAVNDVVREINGD